MWPIYVSKQRKLRGSYVHIYVHKYKSRNCACDSLRVIICYVCIFTALRLQTMMALDSVYTVMNLSESQYISV